MNANEGDRVPNAAQGADTFRRLVEGEIGVDEYVKSLDERVEERREAERPPTPLRPEEADRDR